MSRSKQAELDFDFASVRGTNEVAQNASLGNNRIPANPPENNESGEYPAGEVGSNESHVDEGRSFSMVIPKCSI